MSDVLFQNITEPGPPRPLNRGWRGEKRWTQWPHALSWPPFSTPNPTVLNHQPSPKPTRAPRRANKAAKGSVPCRKPRWSREPPPSAPPCWNRKGRWEEILETFQPEGRRGEGREGGGGRGGENRAGLGSPPHTPRVSPCRPGCPSGIPPFLTSLAPSSARRRQRPVRLPTQSPDLWWPALRLRP